MSNRFFRYQLTLSKARLTTARAELFIAGNQLDGILDRIHEAGCLPQAEKLAEQNAQAAQRFQEAMHRFCEIAKVGASIRQPAPVPLKRGTHRKQR